MGTTSGPTLRIPTLKIRNQIILPFLLLSLLVGIVGTWLSTTLVANSLERRLTDHLVQSEAAASFGITKIEERQLAAVRLIANTAGVDQAVAANDTAMLKELAVPLVVNNPIGHIWLFNADGRTVLEINQPNASSPTELTFGAGRDLASEPLVIPVLQARVDALGDKYVGWLGSPAEFATVGPIRSDSRLVGGVLVASSLPSVLQDIRHESQVEVVLLDQRGHQIGSTLSGAEVVLDQGRRSYLDGSPGRTVLRSSSIAGEPYEFLLTRLYLRQRPVGYLGIAISTKDLTAAGRLSAIQMALLFTAATLGILLIGYSVALRLTRPIEELAAASQAVARGDLARRIPVRRRDELGQLATAFNSMTADLEDRTRALHEQMQRLAQQDSLTDLPNRSVFRDQVQQAIAGAGLRGETRLAVMIMDVDRFKEINDTLGHHNGDLLLQQIGRRLQCTLGGTDIVARLGGDEFAVLLMNVPDPAQAGRAAERLLKALELPFALEGLTIDVGASIGIALYPDHGKDAGTLIQRADIAMYGAKGAHLGFEVYTAERDGYAPTRLALAAELRQALGGESLLLHYQPKAALPTRSVIGVEALVRWNHPRRGLLLPDDFVPLAERVGLMKPLTLQVLNAALAQCHAWSQMGLDLQVAVNLSARSLLDLQLPDEIARLLKKWALSPASLQVEITESTIMADPVLARGVLSRLNAMGVHLSIDDFGTGYSSLANLKQLPVTEIKIDKSFVMGMADNENDAVIVRSVIDLAHNLGLRVVAEGVETERLWNELAMLGCDLAQGIWLGPPLSPADLIPWLGQHSLRLGRFAVQPGPNEASSGVVAQVVPGQVQIGRPSVQKASSDFEAAPNPPDEFRDIEPPLQPASVPAQGESPEREAQNSEAVPRLRVLRLPPPFRAAHARAARAKQIPSVRTSKRSRQPSLRRRNASTVRARPRGRRASGAKLSERRTRVPTTKFARKERRPASQKRTKVVVHLRRSQQRPPARKKKSQQAKSVAARHRKTAAA